LQTEVSYASFRNAQNYIHLTSCSTWESLSATIWSLGPK